MDNQEAKQTKRETTGRMLHVIAVILSILLMSFGFLCYEALKLKDRIFPGLRFEQIWYSVTGDMQGANMDVFNFFFYRNVPLTILGCSIVVLISYKVIIPIFFKVKWLWWLRWVKKGYVFLCAAFCAFCVYYSLYFVGYISYFQSLRAQSSQLYETYYVDPNTVEVTFPEEKRNLIYIFCESMENTYMSDKSGGAQWFSLIPNLTQMCYSNTYFYNPITHNGAQVEYNCDWTVAAMLAHTSGIPMVMPNGQNDYDNYTSFLPGVTNLGDILEAKGYQLELLLGSDAAFGGRKALYTTHGNYTIFDYNTAVERGYIDEDYYVWWGYEDRKLFDYAKEELTTLSEGDEPFAFTMLTADTHYIDGYTDETYQDFYEDNYENAVANSDQFLLDFVLWLQEQDFFANTTIVIAGDHLNMGGSYISQLPEDYPRTVFYCIINSATEYTGVLDHEYTTLDFFPTTLAAMGCKIEGDRLGLGTNLFSNEDTLIDQFGYDTLYDMMAAPSAYYQGNFAVHKNRASAFK
ncbi:MAG: LTA synthase family protein [Lachnospiraceae bacterium]|nr:LTA synthase family protein [Lachnospiraceae bacterium]